ncbi:MAG TPA: hypothetical protein PK413_08840, partial [Thermoanaerobaculia bacterium]|nr:hypothetical protein [Thermoanaerobaculia bacterium]
LRFLLASASGNTTLLAQHYPLLVILNAALAALLQLAGLATILIGIRAARVRPNPFSWLI